MKVTAIRTGKITPGTQTLESILDAHIPPLREGSIIIVTSKIVAICEGRVVKVSEGSEEEKKEQKKDLIAREADYFLEVNPKATHSINITIKNNSLIASAGIDESNGSGYYVLWPANSQKTANAIRAHFMKRFGVKDLGVIITDSHTMALRRGTIGAALAATGFKALKNYVGKEDIFGRELKVTRANIMEGLAAAAVVAMGEGNEQTPLAVIDEVPFVEFQKKNPSAAELKDLRIEVQDDLYAQFLEGVVWKRGGGRGSGGSRRLPGGRIRIVV